jgi:hypothetical protein
MDRSQTSDNKEKRMKKIISLVLAFTLVFALAACGSKDQDPGQEESQDPGIVTPEEGETNVPEDGTEDGATGGDDTQTGNPPGGNTGSTNPQKPSTGGSSTAQKPPSEGSSSGEDSTSSDKGDLNTLMGKIIKGTESDMVVATEEISPDAFPSNLFIDYIDGAKAVASNAMIGSIAHSICLLRLPDGADAAKVAEQINKNKDPRKWICVEAEKAVVVQKGSYILLAMSNTDIVDTVVKNFKAIF